MTPWVGRQPRRDNSAYCRGCWLFIIAIDIAMWRAPGPWAVQDSLAGPGLRPFFQINPLRAVNWPDGGKLALARRNNLLHSQLCTVSYG